MKFRLAALFAFLVTLASPALATNGPYYKPTDTTTTLAALGTASGVAVFNVHVVANNGNYDWNAISTASCDGFSIVCATGVTTGRWILEPVTTPLTPYAINNPSSTTPDLTLTQTGNTATQSIGLLFDPSANTHAGAFKFGAFNYGAFAFTNGPSGQTNYTDDVYTIGMNASSPGNRINTALPAQYLQFESHFYQGGCFGQEFHLINITSTGTQGRPITERVCDDGSNTSMVFSADAGIHFTDTANSVDTLFINTAGHTLDLGAGTGGIRNPQNDTCNIQQFNAGGTAFLCLLQLNSSNHIVIPVPFESIPGPVNIAVPTLGAGNAGMNLNIAGGSQAFAYLADAPASAYLADYVQNTGTGDAIYWAQSTSRDAFSLYTSGSANWATGLDQSDSNAYTICPTNGLGTGCALRFDISTLAAKFSGVIQNTPTTTVASLGTCNSGAIGTQKYVTDAAAVPVYGATVAAGGSQYLRATCNGTNWINL